MQHPNQCTRTDTAALEQLARSFDRSATRRNAYLCSKTALRGQTETHAALRAGFTVVELLVAVSIVAVLASIAVPAVQRSRENSRRILCASHMRQIVHSFQEYYTARRSYPKAGFYEEILPYLGEPESSSRSRLFVCPSDPESIGEWKDNRQSYHMNYGTDSRESNGFSFRAAVARLGPEKFRDGLSNTAAVAERLAWPPIAGQVVYWDDYPEWWKRRLRDTAVHHTDLDRFAEECAERALKPLTVWTRGRGYMHTLTPNQNSCINEHLFDSLYAHTATSMHPGGVNLCLADGAVKFISDSVSLEVWRAIGTRSGSELPSGF